MTKIDQQLDTLTHQLDGIDVQLKKQLSFKRNLLLSIIRGAGYAIGATIIAALLVAILNWTINSVSDIPVLNKIIIPGEVTKIFQTTE